MVVGMAEIKEWLAIILAADVSPALTDAQVMQG